MPFEASGFNNCITLVIVIDTNWSAVKIVKSYE